MKKYNREKRGTYNARINKNRYTHETCETSNRPRIHIQIRYANYNRIEYAPIIYGKTRNTHAQRYVNITNAINDIFPEINAPHTQHVYRATCEYHKYIPQETDYTAPEDLNNIHSTYEDTRTAKCVIFNTQDKVIYYGWMRRTIHIDRYGKNHAKVKITLHKGDRDFEVHTYIPHTDTIKGVSIQELRKNDVELYHI